METHALPPKVVEEKQETTKPTLKVDNKQSEVPVPFSQYQSVKGKTYTEEFFKIDGEEVSLIESTINLIENFVREQIEKKGLEDSTEAYNEVMEKVFSFLGLDKTARSDARLDKVLKLLELMNRQ